MQESWIVKQHNNSRYEILVSKCQALIGHLTHPGIVAIALLPKSNRSSNITPFTVDHREVLDNSTQRKAEIMHLDELRMVALNRVRYIISQVTFNRI